MKNIKITDSGEKLVKLKKACPKILINDHYLNFKQGEAYARESVAKMLNKAVSLLPKNMTFMINDAWRSSEVQEAIFNNFIKKGREKFPDMSEKERLALARKYVAPWKGEKVSSHMTGGALDLRLIKDGRKVPMVSKKFSYQENSKSINSRLPAYLQKNRKLMADVLKKVGFSNLETEYWHWSYGDIHWAKREGEKNAIYGIIDKINIK